VLDDRTGSMSEDTLQRVVQVMEALGYRPNALARSLVRRRTATIGVVIAKVETPLFLQALNTVEPIARDAGYAVLMSNARSPQDEEEVVQVLLDKRVDRPIFLSVSARPADGYLWDLQRQRVPEDVAVIGTDDRHFCTYLNPALTTVRLPVRQAGELAVGMALGRIAGERGEAEHVLLPCSLVVRESCGSHPRRTRDSRSMA
jgi:DNA-binding LacI/PurR family transcriptional regulator